MSLRICLCLIVLVVWALCHTIRVSAAAFYSGQSTAEISFCAVGNTCPNDPFVTGGSTDGAAGPVPNGFGSTASGPDVNAEITVLNGLSGIAIVGEGTGENPGNAVAEPGFGGSVEFSVVQFNSFVLSGPTPGAVVTLTGQFELSAALEARIVNTPGGASLEMAVGPFFGYGTGPFDENNLFAVFPYELNTSGGVVGDNEITTPGTLSLELFDNGGVPDPNVSGTVSHTVGGSGPITIDPNDAFSVPFEVTVGEPFVFGIGMAGDASGGNNFCNVNPPCGGLASLDATLALAAQAIVVPGGFTLIDLVPGDFNFDGRVDGLDFLLWQQDPNVGLLSDWETNYGMVAPLSAASAAVPEPTTLRLAALASVGLFWGGGAWRLRRPALALHRCCRPIWKRGKCFH